MPGPRAPAERIAAPRPDHDQVEFVDGNAEALALQDVILHAEGTAIDLRRAQLDQFEQLLKAYPGLSGADLARVAMLTPQTVGVIIRNLERDSAIRKTPHPIHGRALQWTLTRRGAALLGKCQRHINAVERQLVSGLSADAQAAIRRWLARIASELA